ncbi:glutamate--tRNA ligase [Asticcacaulis sp. ZE23SCel15]|uniref:glutamate--tRNA ligase n=1 Tax=Asticcacaulis sp. ZE23SCel15 TaxID=3059027 RepID=UPI00265F576E|nr:glutamate--tRNA ligase [Asticcacaulis sp. ZE23SCel15]WKL56573.1 glutamate--tRNA ligase [Asticcacaulis sp. ZE23SCel15]
MSDTLSPDVVTRFAPSPTGYLHIGGARTALFNWLYAKAKGGRFLIQIEDTDRERSTPEAVEAIFEGLNWLGLNTDEEIVFQSSREPQHKQVVQSLYQSGHAYACFMTHEETEAARETARASGHALRSPWRDRVPTAEQLATPHVIRFKGPLDEPLVINDAVQGQVSFNTKDMDDLILLRSDGTPTYNLAVVVDDHDMGVTHVIRGDDHLNNAARQTLIYKAAGWNVPTFAHIPLIHGPDGAKLSKRHGAQAVGDYQGLGYLPEAMRNYLARLGWSHGDDEIFNDQQMIDWFDIKDINKAPARLDFDKLNHVNAHWIRECEPKRLLILVHDDLISRGVAIDARSAEIIERTLPLIVERAVKITDFADLLAFALAKRPFQIDEKTKKLLTEETFDRLSRLHENLLSLSDWSVGSLDVTLKNFVENEGVGFGKIGPALRGILSGGHPAPDISRILAALGKSEGLARLKDGLSK